MKAKLTPAQGRATLAAIIASTALLGSFATAATGNINYPGVTDGIMATVHGSNVEHFVRLSQNGDLVDIAKVNTNGVVSEVAATMSGTIVSASAVRQAYYDDLAKFGKIHPRLAAQLAKKPASLEVAIGIKITDNLSALPRPVDTTDIEATIASLAAKYASLQTTFATNKKAIVARLGINAREMVKPLEQNLPDSPFILARLTPARITQIAALADVGIMLSSEGDEQHDLADALAIAGADTAQSTGLSGNNVKVAVYESSPDDSSQLTIESKYTTEMGLTPTLDDHTRHVTGIIRNKNSPGGFAPSARVFSADRSRGFDALDWAIDTKRVSVVNQSFHRDAEIGDYLQLDDIYKDMKLLHYPWTLVVHAAGNWCQEGSACYEGGSSVLDEFVNHKCFNHLSVGNHNDNAGSMAGSSCMVNPTSTHGDRELPEICANGTGVTAVGLTKSGTSMAAPAVTGSVALLHEKQGILKIWPEGVRALLFAGSLVNVHTHDGQLPDGNPATNAPGSWWSDMTMGRDGFDGAGAMNINRSVLIANHRTGRSGASLERGWDIGLMNGNSFGAGNFFTKTYNVAAPKVPLTGSKLRVALAWDNTLNLATDSQAALRNEPNMDLDLRIYEVAANGALIQTGVALSYDNCYEVADLSVRAGARYVIKIHRWKGTASDWTWFGVAWDIR